MRVRAADGLRVPMEHAPRSYIEAKPQEVADTPYYRRRLAAGELVRVDAPAAPPAEAATPPAPKKGSKA
ncbi:hypothetical protein MBSD_n1570 [Mizugakiibacter sediminis]|uniref:DUF2635 domain-containing protein n=1 Tax=Mizugakiibacter sediminis TaxID=1475481 RepID=A0A0K8QNI9_9GAMM|nr:DUF2635 domain-containing protein [Mizugakiibacter sediminis]GAP66266.1 hypothetical protein MBSD_n1570 [Mizugakiibacter sediminis]